MRLLVWLVPALLLVGLGYWLFILTEGAYLGPRAVRFLYDWGAKSYDQVKAYDQGDDAWNLAIPLEKRLRGWREPLILDVGTGTGRVLLSLLRRPDFQGHLVGLDLSLPMLQEARRKVRGYGCPVSLIWQEACLLPFPDRTFAAVACIEALEFMPSPAQSLKEMARVLAPGGTLLVSNRAGRDALFFPGRALGRKRLQALLASLSLEEVEMKPWQGYYDLIWAKKRGKPPSRPPGDDICDILLCPRCRGPLTCADGGMICPTCHLLYPSKDGILNLERPLYEDGRNGI
jgi:ubiquinone/menaquinone biosynthesis C-methylase UbiE